MVGVGGTHHTTPHNFALLLLAQKGKQTLIDSMPFGLFDSIAASCLSVIPSVDLPVVRTMLE